MHMNKLDALCSELQAVRSTFAGPKAETLHELAGILRWASEEVRSFARQHPYLDQRTAERIALHLELMATPGEGWGPDPEALAEADSPRTGEIA